MSKILSPSFFNRPTDLVARDLLGKYLVRRIEKKVKNNANIKRGGNIKKIYQKTTLQINEVEIYDGFDDLASHASHGKTERNKVMFGKPGYFYVYFTYGMHYMLNIVTREKGYPAAILIRGAGEIRGPGRLTKFLKIDKKINGKKAMPKNDLWFEDENKNRKLNLKMIKTARVGVSYAGKWAKKKYRFLLKK